MRVRLDTPERLVLDQRPWMLGGGLAVGVLAFAAAGLATVVSEPWLGLAMFAGMGLFGLAFALFVRRSIAVFDRPAGAVVLRSSTVLGVSETTLRLDRILGAEVQSSRAQGTDGTSTATHRAALRLRGGTPVPLSAIYVSGGGARRAAAAVERWLAAGR